MSNDCDKEDEKEVPVEGECSTSKAKAKPCRERTDRLAIPKGDRVLGVYQCHAYHMSRPRVELMKARLQEIYAMSPEETKKYFQEAMERSRKMALRRKLREKLRAEFRKRKRRAQEDCAYKFVYRLLIKGMRFAARHPVPPLVCVRLRNLSDIVLEQLCDLRNINHPSRDDPDKTGLFMMTVADWFAVAIEVIYYVVQYKKNRELEEIERQQQLNKLKLEMMKSETEIRTTEPASECDCV